MPDESHIKLRTEFLLKGYYEIEGKKGSTCHVIDRLSDGWGNTSLYTYAEWLTPANLISTTGLLLIAIYIFLNASGILPK